MDEKECKIPSPYVNSEPQKSEKARKPHDSTLHERFRDLCREIIQNENLQYVKTEPRPAKNQDRLVRHKLRDARTKGLADQTAPPRDGGRRHRAEKDCEHGTKGRNLLKSARQEPERRTNKHRRRKRERKFAALIPGKTQPYVRETHRCSCSCTGRRSGERDWGLIRVPYHVQCRRGLGRARRGHIPSNRDGVRGAAHRIGVVYPAAGAGSTTIARALLPLPRSAASRSTDQPSRPTKPTRDRRERRFLRNLTGEVRTERSGERTAMARRRSRESLEEGPRLYRFHSTGNAPHSLHLFSPLPPLRPHRSAPARQWHACGNRQR